MSQLGQKLTPWRPGEVPLVPVIAARSKAPSNQRLITDVSGFAFGAPVNTPAEIVDRLNREINAALAAPGMKARLAAIGGEPLSGSPAEFGKLIAEETKNGPRWFAPASSGSRGEAR